MSEEKKSEKSPTKCRKKKSLKKVKKNVGRKKV